MADTEIHGLLNLNKPPGMTSRDAVNRVNRLARRVKAGHAGTLDPLACGVLIVCLGRATRLIEYVQGQAKQYRATFLLGRESPTEDTDGPVTELPNPAIPSLAAIEAASRKLVGPIDQRPPAFSALKIAGRRAYDLARQGQTVNLAPRLVEIHDIQIEGYNYPELRLRIDCGSGTYVRSLGRDLAASVGSAAVMSALVRTAIGGFRLEDAVSPDDLTPGNWLAHLLPPLVAVTGLPRVELTWSDVDRLRRGQFIRDLVPTSAGESPRGGPDEYAGTDPEGRLVAILVPRGPSLWGASRNLMPG